jgi:hypothetical protein
VVEAERIAMEGVGDFVAVGRELGEVRAHRKIIRN